MNACGEHVIPESTCTIRLCLVKQESPDFRQGSVQADCLVSNVKLAHFVKGSVKAFNTFLAYEGIVEDFSNGMFSTDREDNEKEVIYFSTALKSLHYARKFSQIRFQDLKSPYLLKFRSFQLF